MSVYTYNELPSPLIMARIKKGQHWGGDWTEKNILPLESID